MTARFAQSVEKGVAICLAATFALPLALGLLLLLRPVAKRAPPWLSNRTLSGVQLKPELVSLLRPTVLSASYQAYVANNYARQFVGREMMIRLVNELYLHFFHVANSEIVVGRNLSLFERVYAEEYCLRRGDQKTLLPLVTDLRQMQDFCAARGIPFALVITPSKAAIYPEDLPSGWMARYKPASRFYDLFLPLLKQNGIYYVDGHRIAADLKRTAQVPVFPLSGCHWGDPAALATANAVFELLARQGLGVTPIRDFTTANSTQPNAKDRDLGNLVNIVSPWRCPVTNVSVRPPQPGHAYRPNAVFVGGSFTSRLLDYLDASRQFSELELYFYYKVAKDCWVDGEAHRIAEPTAPLDFETDVFAADALVLECNEQTLDKPAGHLVAFLRDALARLPEPHAAKAPFRYENRLTYRWGENLQFAPGDHSVKLAATKGFAPPLNGGSRTVGPVASIHFTAPAPVGDVRLEIDAKPFYIGDRLPEQRVTVYVNGQAVGEWTWRSAQAAKRELTIPSPLLSGGEVWLEFKVARPISPSELGMSRDSRKYGISISSLRLRETGVLDTNGDRRAP